MISVKHQILGQWKILVCMATDTVTVFSTDCSTEKCAACNMRESTANWHSLLTPNFETDYRKMVAQI
jgi:hypothetical protein